MDSFVPAVRPETAILPLLNGLRYIDAPQARLGDAHGLGQCLISASLDPAVGMPVARKRSLERRGGLAYGGWLDRLRPLAPVGSSRLLRGSNSQSGSPAPGSIGLGPTGRAIRSRQAAWQFIHGAAVSSTAGGPAAGG
jgi:hypothetical protein